jgi:hypothetical protein
VTRASAWRLARFRQNEALRGSAGGLPGPFGFRCECGDRFCQEFVLVEADNVHAVRPNPRRLVMANGHESEHERIVLEYDGYVVVELG